MSWLEKNYGLILWPAAILGVILLLSSPSFIHSTTMFLKGGSLVSWSADIDSRATIGANPVIGKRVEINPPATIGDNVFINDDAYLGSVVVEDNVRIGIKALIQGCCNNNICHGTNTILIRENAVIEGHVIINPGVTVGRYATVLAGSVVSEDVPDNAVVAGNPAKVIEFWEIGDGVPVGENSNKNDNG